MHQVQILVGDLHRGHLGSPEVTSRFLLITHNWKVLETWVWSHWACHVTTHRLIMRHDLLGSAYDLKWPCRRSNIDLIIRSHHVCICYRQCESQSIRELPRHFANCRHFARCLGKVRFALGLGTSRTNWHLAIQAKGEASQFANCLGRVRIIKF